MERSNEYGDAGAATSGINDYVINVTKPSAGSNTKIIAAVAVTALVILLIKK